jgi:hypothetical protein
MISDNRLHTISLALGVFCVICLAGVTPKRKADAWLASPNRGLKRM